MASSERLRSIFWCLGAALSLLVVGACAQVTGLSDDYRYDLVEAGSDAAVTDGASRGEAGTDAGADTGSAADRCTAQERAQAQNAIVQANGDNLTATCRTCLATSCCDEIAACAGDPSCEQSMECVFGCMKSGNRSQCLGNCSNVFATQVGACVQRSCGAPTCQLN